MSESESLAIVVLAAGLGKRMGQKDLPKVAVATSEAPLIQHVLSSASRLSPKKIVVVTGHKREVVEKLVKEGASREAYSMSPISFAVQKEQLGTGDAVKAAQDSLKGFIGTVLILFGDVPLTNPATLAALIQNHHDKKATLSVLTLLSNRNTAYGRIIRDENGALLKNIEAKDCSPAQILIQEHNSGIYAVDSAFLWPAVSELKNENSQKEYYLSDIIERAVKEGQRVGTISTSDADEVQGVNTPADMALVNRSLLKLRIERLINTGVQVEDPNSLYVDPQVKIAPSATIGPSVQLRGDTRVAEGVTIEGSALIINSSIEKGAHIKLSVRIEDSKVGPEASVGPFANLRPGTVLGKNVKIGNFVETKKAVLKDEAKASHLTYLGDCNVGEGSNIGAGTITCNYDGKNKHVTTIGKNVFIGSDTCLVAPVTVNDGAYVGAGSVITKDVERDSLAVARAQQVVKPGWAKRKRGE